MMGWKIRFLALALAASIFWPAPSAAQNQPISGLPIASTLSGIEKIPAIQAGAAVAIQPNQIVALAGGSYQPLDCDLSSIAGATTTGLFYRSATCTWSLLTLSSHITLSGGALDVAGVLLAANNLTDVASASSARTNLGLGTAALANTGTSGGTVPFLNGANTFSGANAFPGGLTGTLTGNVVGSATNLATSRTIDVLTGDVTSAGASFNGTASTTATTTLATVNANVGACGTTSAYPIITLNAKGLATGCSTQALGTAATVNTGTSGPTIPLLNSANLWSLSQTFGQGISLSPPASATPTIIGQCTFQFTSNTALDVRCEGSDGIVRSGTIPLS